MKSRTGDTMQFMHRLWQLAHALDVSSKRMEQAIGVTGPQRLVIRVVGATPYRTASEIATTLGKHPSTLTGVLARLEQRGLILREVDPADRRRARFTLTAAGKRVDRQRRGTVEAACTRALGRAKRRRVASTLDTLGFLIEELERDH
jgi:DNA-binding MarR family transcriptional regulator